MATNIFDHRNPTMSPTSAPPTTQSSKMHSKHDQPHNHTMTTTYVPQYSTYRHRPANTSPTWPEKQASLILSLRDMSNPPTRTPDCDIRALDPEFHIHARWTDPDLVRALSRLQRSLTEKVHLSLRYGGRDVTAATWVTVHETSPDEITELKYVLWFHEYDDLDVEVGELRDVEWGIKKEEGEGEGMEWGVKEEEVEVEVKLEDMES